MVLQPGQRCAPVWERGQKALGDRKQPALNIGCRLPGRRKPGGVRKDYAPENMAMFRHITLNLLKQETTLKRGIKAKRLEAGWDEAYLLKVLGIAS